VSRSHDILRDATETELVTTFSDCREAPPPPSAGETARDLTLPEQTLELALSTPIDPATAAAGDVISARLMESILRPKSSGVFAPAGSIVTGRIVQMGHRLSPKNYFVVSMAFDRVQVDGKVLKLRIKADANPAATNPQWPMGTFTFPAKNSRYVIPAGFKSKWRTTASASGLTAPLAQPPVAPPNSP
jgi:hypothetical protein